MISFSVVVTASLSESECKGREFWDSGKMSGRFFLFFRRFSMNSDKFWAVSLGFAGIFGGLGRFGGEGIFGSAGDGARGGLGKPFCRTAKKKRHRWCNK